MTEPKKRSTPGAANLNFTLGRDSISPHAGVAAGGQCLPATCCYNGNGPYSTDGFGPFPLLSQHDLEGGGFDMNLVAIRDMRLAVDLAGWATIERQTQA